MAFIFEYRDKSYPEITPDLLQNHPESHLEINDLYIRYIRKRYNKTIFSFSLKRKRNKKNI